MLNFRSHTAKHQALSSQNQHTKRPYERHHDLLQWMSNVSRSAQFRCNSHICMATLAFIASITHHLTSLPCPDPTAITAQKQIIVNKGHARYLTVVGDLEHELPLAVPVLHHIAGLQSHAHKQVRLNRTHGTKREGIQGRRSGSRRRTALGSARKSCTERSTNSSHESTYTMAAAAALARCGGSVVGIWVK